MNSYLRSVGIDAEAKVKSKIKHQTRIRAESFNPRYLTLSQLQIASAYLNQNAMSKFCRIRLRNSLRSLSLYFLENSEPYNKPGTPATLASLELPEPHVEFDLLFDGNRLIREQKDYSRLWPCWPL